MLTLNRLTIVATISVTIDLLPSARTVLDREQFLRKVICEMNDGLEMKMELEIGFSTLHDLNSIDGNKSLGQVAAQGMADSDFLFVYTTSCIDFGPKIISVNHSNKIHIII